MKIMPFRKKLARWALDFAYRSDPTLKIEIILPIDYRSLGLRDAGRTGWYRAESCELCEGFAIAPTDTVVDVGCGDGGNIQFCARYAAHVIAIDIDQKRLQTTEQRLKSGKPKYTTHLSDANPLPLDSGVADKVICTEVLEHVDDPAQVLNELFRVGKQGATYLLTVPDARSEFVMKRVGPPNAFQKPNHIRVIQRDEFEKMVTDVGLVIKNHSYRGFYWAVWHAFAWRCGVSVMKGSHPVLNHWARTWSAVLDMPNGQDCKLALDEVLPKSQVIVAVKP